MKEAGLAALEKKLSRDFDEVYLRFEERMHRVCSVLRYADRATRGWEDDVAEREENDGWNRLLDGLERMHCGGLSFRWCHSF